MLFEYLKAKADDKIFFILQKHFKEYKNIDMLNDIQHLLQVYNREELICNF